MTFFWFLGFVGFQKKNPNENQLGFHMRYHLFLHYGWFLLNLEKDFKRTNIHMTLIDNYNLISLLTTCCYKTNSCENSTPFRMVNHQSEFKKI